ncbi:Ig-like domain-containing protein [Arthrobacter sp. I2-34]|uniref:Ig-like domain-containing protein n=1 Tax=Arthrobacter hankyongi TaxID=2904801 RepID=A0ABS9LCD0_9MICC|nr:Ig-like domain-containing protein [Arthrobacter hankyongi]MCG2624338.1 Ig-like domain-containing protein [Arthrobacter hankyongi]
MNADFRRSLTATADEVRSRAHPADPNAAIMRGIGRYRRRIWIAYIAAAAVAAVLAGSLFLTRQVLSDAELTAINVQPSPAVLRPKAQLQFAAEGAYSNGDRGVRIDSVDWQSDNPAVARIDGSGRVSALQPGTATITASQKGIKGTVKLTVTKANLRSITVNPSPITLKPGEHRSLTATGKYDDGATATLVSPPVKWETSNKDVARVDAKGQLSGVSQGTATITAIFEGVKRKVKLSVTEAGPTPETPEPQPTLASIRIDGPRQLTEGEHQPIAAVGIFSDKTERRLESPPVQWSSSDPNIARIDGDQIVAVSQGNISLKATWGGSSGTLDVAVGPSSPGCTPSSLDPSKYNGRTFEVVKAELEANGWRVEAHEQSAAEAPGVVLAVSANCTSDGEAVATVVYSTGPTGPQVPDVIGKSVADAEVIISGQGLVPLRGEDQFSGAPQGTVVDQNPKAGTAAPPQSTVTYYVSAGPGTTTPT